MDQSQPQQPQPTGPQQPNQHILKPLPDDDKLSQKTLSKVETQHAVPEPDTDLKQPATPEEDPTAKFQKAIITAGKVQKENAELKVRMAQLEKQAQEHDDWRQSLADPDRRLKLLQSHGISAKDLVQDMVSATEEPKTAEQLEKEQLIAKVEELEQWQKQTIEGQQQYAEQSHQDKAYQYAAGFLEKNKDKYPRLAALGGTHHLVSEYQRRQQETGADPDEHEVAKHLEDFVTKKLDDQLSRLREYGILPGTPGQDQTIEQKPAQPAMSLGQKPTQPTAPADRPTLTSDMSAAPSSGVDYAEIMRREGPNSMTLRDIAIRKALEKNAAP